MSSIPSISVTAVNSSARHGRDIMHIVAIKIKMFLRNMSAMGEIIVHSFRSPVCTVKRKENYMVILTLLVVRIMRFQLSDD